MSVLLNVARGAAAVNLILLFSLCYVWGSNYRRHGANHTLGLLIFAGFLVIQNVLWLYLYLFDGQFIRWFGRGNLTFQLSVTGLCGLQTLALVALVKITWR